MSGHHVGVLGCGIMGSTFARCLADCGFMVHLWNRSGRNEHLLEGDVLLATPREVVERSQVILICLADEEAVEGVLNGLVVGALQEEVRGKSFLQMSTISVEGTKRIAAHVEAQGARYVDAPISGSRASMEQGRAVVLLGSNEALNENELLVLDVIAPLRFFCSEIGHATALKLCVNVLLAQMTTGLAEAVHLARSLGIAPEAIFELLWMSPTLRCSYFESKREAMLGDKVPPSFPLKHMLKDLRLALGVTPELPVTFAAKELFAAAEASGLGCEDVGVVGRAIPGAT